MKNGFRLVSTDEGTKRELDTSVVDYSVSGDKIYYQLINGEIRYIDISYE